MALLFTEQGTREGAGCFSVTLIMLGSLTLEGSCPFGAPSPLPGAASFFTLKNANLGSSGKTKETQGLVLKSYSPHHIQLACEETPQMLLLKITSAKTARDTPCSPEPNLTQRYLTKSLIFKKYTLKLLSKEHNLETPAV